MAVGGRARSRVTCLRPGRAWLSGNLRPTWPSPVSGNPARPSAHSSRAAWATGAAAAPAGPPRTCKANETPPKPQAAPQASQRGRELVFPSPQTTSFVGNPKRTPERAQPGAAPKRGPGVCEKGGPAGARGRFPGNLAQRAPNGAVAASPQGGGGFPRRCNGRRGRGPSPYGGSRPQKARPWAGFRVTSPRLGGRAGSGLACG